MTFTLHFPVWLLWTGGVVAGVVILLLACLGVWMVYEWLTFSGPV